ncbi:MAG: T9SS type A sorting domain-containing protein [Candidatus Cloacimonetes bacterium]|nr:T9SS type A sorting domain-containing protein [Candidatus Cloacimonadota bacterium]
MKRFFLLVIVLIISLNIFSLEKWKSYTNTNNISDIIVSDNDLIIASWGGVAHYNLQTLDKERIYTIIEGLSDNDAKTLEYDQESKIYYIGTKKGGISRLQNDEFLMPISENLGLMSNFVHQMKIKNNYLYVATDQGLSVFNISPELSLPILVKNINTENGLNHNDIVTLEISENYLFCGSQEGITYAHLDSLIIPNSWNYLTENNSSLEGNIIHSIAVKKNGNSEYIAVATNSSVWIASIPDFTEILIVDSANIPEESGFFPVFWDSDSNIWFSTGTWDEVALTIQDTTDICIVKIEAVIEGNPNYTYWYEEDFPTKQITSFLEIDGRIAVSTWGEGFFILESGTWQNHKANCIIANYVKDLEIDHNSKLWISNGYLGLYPIGIGTKGVSSFDGENWTNFAAETSELRSNNIVTISIDSFNRKWFGSWNTANNGTDWQDGINIFDEENNTWSAITKEDGLYTDLIADIDFISDDEIWVSTFDGGVNILNIEGEVIHSFTIDDPTAEFENKIVQQHHVDNFSFVGTYFMGVSFWENDSYPELEQDEYWHQANTTALTTGRIYDIVSRKTDFSTEIWIASSNGLFMHDGDTWFRYGAVQKKQFYDGNSWEPQDLSQTQYATPDYWYIEGQERLYGAAVTFPTALYVDPFNRIWIGTNDNGFTIYSPEEDHFENHYYPKSPLLSNTITSFAYKKYTGTLYVGTQNGLNSVEIGMEDKFNSQIKLWETIAYPNPFYPQKNSSVTIMNSNNAPLPQGDTTCKIYDLSGDLIITLEKNIYQKFVWNGLNSFEKKCSSGIYLYVVSAEFKKISKGKIVLIR